MVTFCTKAFFTYFPTNIFILPTTSTFHFRTAKVHYGTSLSNVDWLHGGAESLLTLTNIFIVLGLREALKKARDENGNTSKFTVEANEDEKSSV